MPAAVKAINTERIGTVELDDVQLPNPAKHRVAWVQAPAQIPRLSPAMASLPDVVNNIQADNLPLHNDAYQDDGHATDTFDASAHLPASPRPPSPKLAFKSLLDVDSVGHTTPTFLANSRHSYCPSPPLSPAARTGPPRSLSFSYNYALPSSLSSPSYINHDYDTILEQPIRPRAFTDNDMHDDSSIYDLTPRETHFRGPLDNPPEQKDRERECVDRRGKRRDASLWDGFKSRWLPDTLTGSPNEETSGADWVKEKEKDGVQPSGGPSHAVSSSVASGSGSGSGLARLGSMSTQGKGRDNQRQDSQTQTQGSKSPSTNWSRLRFLLPRVISSSPAKEPPPSAVAPSGVNITDELTVGGLSALILRLWFERDERGRRRVPILLHRLRIRISDSLHPLHGSHSVFRIECEYANGAIRWVIYRQLRDFLSLHAHCAVSNAYNRNIEKLPEFPRTSGFLGTTICIQQLISISGIPYFKFLKKESRERGSDVSRADFARLQREALENYLIDLIRAVVSTFPICIYILS